MVHLSISGLLRNKLLTITIIVLIIIDFQQRTVTHTYTQTNNNKKTQKHNYRYYLGIHSPKLDHKNEKLLCVGQNRAIKIFMVILIFILMIIFILIIIIIIQNPQRICCLVTWNLIWWLCLYQITWGLMVTLLGQTTVKQTERYNPINDLSLSHWLSNLWCSWC